MQSLLRRRRRILLAQILKERLMNASNKLQVCLADRNARLKTFYAEKYKANIIDFEKQSQNVCLQKRLKMSKEVALSILSSNLFHKRRPATLNAQSP